MKTYIIIFTLLLAAAISLNAQSGTVWQHQFEIEGGYHIPSGDERDLYDLQNGYGGTITYYYQLPSRNLFLSLSAGVSTFKSNKLSLFGISNTDLWSIPVLAGARFNFTLSGIQPYIGIETGVDFLSLDFSALGISLDKINETDFVAEPKAGIRIPLVPQVDLDLNVKYNVFFKNQTFNILGINIGIAYTVVME